MVNDVAAATELLGKPSHHTGAISKVIKFVV
jgi:hypothetical protein